MPHRSPASPTVPPETRASAIGRAAGAAILALRKDDGATRDAPYTPGMGAGKWRPHPNPVPPNPPIANADLARGYLPSSVPGWANVTPFTLLSASQFWLPGPPALTSATYARDYNEVKSVGGKVSTARTDDQTQIARFWFEGPGAWNTIARTVATTRGLDARDSARVLALMNMAMADAYIAGWKIRYVYDSWRPVTAIREGDNDGNDATVGDPTLGQSSEHACRLGLSVDPKHLQRGGRRGPRDCPGRRSGQLHGHERQALRRDHAIVHELFSGGARERRLPGLCRDPFP